MVRISYPSTFPGIMRKTLGKNVLHFL